MCLIRVLLLLLVSLPGCVFAKDEYTLNQYAKDCAKLITEAPAFNCLDLEVVPITVDGITPEKYTPHMACDRPAMLPYPAQSDGQCTPYSRVKTVRDDNIQMLLFCRRMYIRPKDDPHFDSMEIIMHNVVNGSTCFFIGKNFGDNPAGLDGTRVPPPTETEAPSKFPSAAKIWATPHEVVDHGCIYCHDSDPWMLSPWIDQTGQLPADPWGFHSVDVGGPFAQWPKPMSIRTRGNSCVGCHRIGSLNTCRAQIIPTFGEQPAKMLQSIGQAPHGVLGARPGSVEEEPLPVFSKWALTYPNSYWMPIGNKLPLGVWNLIYKDDVEALQRCCEDHDAPGCSVTPIHNRKLWLANPQAKEATGY